MRVLLLLCLSTTIISISGVRPIQTAGPPHWITSEMVFVSLYTQHNSWQCSLIFMNTAAKCVYLYAYLIVVHV